MIKLYIYCSVLIIGNVKVDPDIGMKFHQEVMEIVSYDSFIWQSHIVQDVVCDKLYYTSAGLMGQKKCQEEICLA